MLKINTRTLIELGLPENAGTIIAAANQATEKLTKNSDRTDNQIGSILRTDDNLPSTGYAVNAYEIPEEDYKTLLKALKGAK